MDGSSHVARVVGTFMPIDFMNSLFETELHIAVPLPFFLNKNLCVLIDEASTLPTIKSNPLPGESKGIHILDIDKLSTHFGKELSITCSQWTKAALNMYRFQQARDALSDESEHATWFDNHFSFFNIHKDRDELYDAWKVVELELCKDHCSQNLAFNAADHDAAFERAQLSYNLHFEFQTQFQTLMSVSQGSKIPSVNAHGGGNGYTKFKPAFNRSHPTSQSFPSGSGRLSSSSSSSYCLICAEKGHTVFAHWDSSTPSNLLTANWPGRDAPARASSPRQSPTVHQLEPLR